MSNNEAGRLVSSTLDVKSRSFFLISFNFLVVLSLIFLVCMSKTSRANVLNKFLIFLSISLFSTLKK